MTNTEQQKRYAYQEGLISVILNTLLFILKYWVGIASGSVAILADAWHTISDSLTSLVVIVSAKISVKPADKEHPFGHGRMELISSLIIAVLLAVVSLGFIKDAALKLFSQTPANYAAPAVIVTAISIVLKLLMAVTAFRWGKKSEMKSIEADGWHHFSDAVSSAVILIGIFFARYVWWIDSAMAFIVSLILLYIVYQLLKESANSLIGEDAGDGLIEELVRIANDVYPEGLNIHHIHIHRYGKHSEMTCHVRLPDTLPIKKAHKIATDLENTIRERLQIEATVHIEPLSARKAYTE